MSEQSEVFVTTPSASTAERNDPLAGVRQLAYAWVGLWGVASVDLDNFYQRCVARGQQIMNSQSRTTPSEAKPHVLEAVAGKPLTTAARRIRPMSIVNIFGAVESYHIDLNAEGLLPTKPELDALSERVEGLAREVDTLVKQREQVS